MCKQATIDDTFVLWQLNLTHEERDHALEKNRNSSINFLNEEDYVILWRIKKTIEIKLSLFFKRHN